MCKPVMYIFSIMLYFIVKAFNKEKACFGRIFSVSNLCTHSFGKQHLVIEGYWERMEFDSD